MPTITAPTTWRLAQRFVWKEYRMLRELALGVIGLALVAMLFVQNVSAESVRASAVMLIAIGAAAMTAIAAAVTLFSVETEEGTAELLRILPSQRRAQFLGKIAAGVGTVLAVLAITVAFALLLVGPPPNAGAYASQGALVLAEAFVWALLASLLCPNPLVAAVLGIAGASLNSQLAMALTTAQTIGYTLSSYQAAVPARLVLIAIVGALDVWLGLHWPRPIAVAKSSTRTKTLAAVQPTRRRWQTEFWRFVWQTVRQSWKTAAGAALLGIALTIVFFVVTMQYAKFPAHRPFTPFLGLLFTPALFGTLVFRADQRQRQYRFVSERIGRPSTFWLARQVVWISPLVVACVVLSLLIWLMLDFYHSELLSGYYHSWQHSHYLGRNAIERVQLENWLATWTVLEFVCLTWSAFFTAYSIGQLCSITVRSGVLSGMLALLASILLTAWGMVIFAWRLPALWFMAPIGVMALLASWLYVRDWLFERTRVRTWLIHVGLILMPFIVLPFMRPHWRAAQLAGEFPAPYLAESSQSFSDRVGELALRRRRGVEVSDAYMQLAEKADKATPEKPFADEDLAEFIRLSKIECYVPPSLNAGQAFDNRFYRLQQAVFNSYFVLSPNADPYDPMPEGEEISNFRQLTLEQQLERILAVRRLCVQTGYGFGWRINDYQPYGNLSEELLSWATLPEQTPELLMKAVKELHSIGRRRPKPSDGAVDTYSFAMAVAQGTEQPHFLRQNDYHPTNVFEWLAYFAQRLAGEQSRSERAARIFSTLALEYALQSEQLLARHAENDVHVLMKRERLSDWGWNLTPLEMLTRSRGDRNLDEIKPQARLLEHAATSYLIADEMTSQLNLSQQLREWFDQEARYKAERVRLALLAYRLKEGAYPKTLEQLSPDFMTPHEYQDPYGTGPFGYAPEGFSQRLFFNYDSTLAANGVAPNTPVLWSIGVGGAKPTLSWSVLEENDRGTMDETIVERNSEYAVGKRGEEVMTLESSFADHGAFWLPLPK